MLQTVSSPSHLSHPLPWASHLPAPALERPGGSESRQDLMATRRARSTRKEKYTFTQNRVPMRYECSPRTIRNASADSSGIPTLRETRVRTSAHPGDIARHNAGACVHVKPHFHCSGRPRITMANPKPKTAEPQARPQPSLRSTSPKFQHPPLRCLTPKDPRRITRISCLLLLLPRNG